MPTTQPEPPDFGDVAAQWDAWQKNRAIEGSPFAVYFVCKNCERPLALECVIELARDEEHPRQVSILYYCVCTIAIMVQSVVATLPALTALFGKSIPFLPYESPFMYRADTDVDADPLLARWRWELEQCPDTDDFLLFTEDARQRRGT